MSTPFQISRRVEFGDTDMAGIMHFSNFFRFMEVAETAFLRSRGLSVCWLDQGHRVGFPRVSATCDYLKPALFEEMIDLSVTLEKVGRKSITYRFDFSRAGEAIAVGHISAVYCRTTPGHGIESLEIPLDLRAKLEAAE